MSAVPSATDLRSKGDHTIIASPPGQTQQRSAVQRDKKLQRTASMKPMRVGESQRGRCAGFAPVRHILVDRGRSSEEFWPQCQGVKLFRSRDHKHVQRLMILQICKRHSRGDYCLLEIKAQHNISLMLLRHAPCQVRGLDL